MDSCLRRHSGFGGPFRAVNNAEFDITKAEPFLQALWKLDSIVEPRMTLYGEAVKVRLKFRDREFVIDYNFEEPETVFILSRQDGKLFVLHIDYRSLNELGVGEMHY
jgi:hypothetical protein